MTSSHGEPLGALAGDLAAALDPERAPEYAQFAIRTRSALAQQVLRTAGQTARLGHVIAVGTDPRAHEKALALLDEAVGRRGPLSLPDDVVPVRAGLLLRAGRDDEVRELLAHPALEDLDRWMLRADLVNPHRARADGETPRGATLAAAEKRWLRVLNEAFTPDGLEPVSLLPPEPTDTPYRRLQARTSDRVDGDLVTVVMSAFNPDQDLLLAVRGILEQTWRNLELLIIDDCSSAPETSRLLEVAEGMDRRVRVVRAPHNRGTYAARNLAMSIARGRWMTFQDSDDWTHPRRIEHQVRHLLSSRKVLANRTRTLRAYQDLSLTFVGYPAERLNASSLLFDRLAVHRLVGDFDTTRKSGDMELPLRLRALQRGSVHNLPHPTPLAITQLRPGSLSRDDALPGWTRWDRLAYREAYREWHRNLSSEPMTASVRARAGRPFPLPHPRWYPDPASAPEAAPFDVLVLGDLSRTSPRAHRTLGAARTAAHAGLSTGVAHAESPHPLAPRRSVLIPELSSDVRLGRLRLSNAGEEDETGLLVVTDPASLLHLGHARLRVGTVLVVVDDAEPVGWSVAAVDDRCREIFGGLPRWGGPARVHGADTASSAVRTAVGENRWHGADLDLVAGAGWLTVDAARSRSRTTGPAGEPFPTPAVVLGHHLPDEPGRWPSPEQLALAYPSEVGGTGGRSWPVEVHSLRGARTLTEALGKPVADPAWCSFAHTTMTPREFLSHIDVWAYFGEWDEAAEIGALEALGAGLPLLLGKDAADLGLEGRIRYVAAGSAREALEGLLADTSHGDNSSRRREATWCAAMAGLLSGQEAVA